jgi:hypothetical protein
VAKTEKRIHSRIVVGGIILMIAFAAWLFMFGGLAYLAPGP